MRKNNSKVLKESNKSPGKNGRGSSSNGPTKACSDSTTFSKESRTPEIQARNSTKKSSWKDDPELNGILQLGIDCKNNKNFQGAIQAFEKAIKKSPKCSLAYWLLGGMHFTYLHDPQTALPFLQKAVALSPKTEMASLGLFHALWALDRLDEALAEIKRYQHLTNWKCKDYLEIVAEMYQKWLPEKHQKKKAKTSPRGQRS